jgi:pyridoxal/pyridoxine/pyridoxamine kinase
MDHLNFYYILTGAATLIFSNALEARQLTGVDSRSETQVTRHADVLANLLFPEIKP